jgi:von Willebrand factor type A domain
MAQGRRCPLRALPNFAGGTTMRADFIAAAILTTSIVLIALALGRGWKGGQGKAGMLRRTARFAGGPFSLSITLHAVLLLFLIITVHESRARNLIMVNLVAGGGGGNGDELRDLDLPEIPMPDVSPPSLTEPTASDTVQAVAIATDFVHSASGIGLGGSGGGIGTSYGRGLGPGFGGYVLTLRRKGLDVVLVIDGTDSMRLIMADVKARMRALVEAIHHLVPTARFGIIVYGGNGESIDVQPLTIMPSRLDGFLGKITAKGGGEWEENLAGALDVAIDRMDWKPYAKKVIVVVGDSPPHKKNFAAIVRQIKKFRSENGTLNTVDVSAQEHERFERAFAMEVHHESLKKIPPMPAFFQQTRAAFEALAMAGGGEMHSLEGDQRVDREILVLAFGHRWQEQLAAFARE